MIFLLAVSSLNNVNQLIQTVIKQYFPNIAVIQNMGVLWQIGLYEIYCGILLVCQNTTMRAYGAWIKTYCVSCSTTYSKVSKRRIVLFSCYLPPHNSTRGRDASLFFGHLLSKVYLHWDADLTLICGDLNSRVGDKDDVVSDIDAVETREPIDVHAKPNQHGLEFPEILNEAKMCMLNGRGDRHKDNSTCINTHCKSVVDFMCVPHDCLSYCSNFEVNTSRELISINNLEGCVGDAKHIPDHPMLIKNAYFTAGWPSTDYNPGFACNNNKDPVATTRYKRNIPDCFLQSDLCRSSISILINYFDQVYINQESVDNIYHQFCNVYYDELCRLNMKKNGRERARNRKPVGKRHGER